MATPKELQRFNITLTRFALPDGQKLGYMKWGEDWRLVHRSPDSNDAVIGPIYKTKVELLTDLARQAEQFGF